MRAGFGIQSQISLKPMSTKAQIAMPNAELLMPSNHSIATPASSDRLINILALSPSSLAELYLSQLNQGANTRKEIIGLFDRLLDEVATALLVRSLIEHREVLAPPRKITHAKAQERTA
jgi:hypothetical protein